MSKQVLITIISNTKITHKIHEYPLTPCHNFCVSFFKGRIRKSIGSKISFPPETEFLELCALQQADYRDLNRRD